MPSEQRAYLSRSACLDHLFKLRKKRTLSRKDLSICGSEIKPFGAIDLWKFLKLPKLWRPLHPETGASDQCRVDIAFHGPDGNDFSTRLAQRLQRNSHSMNFKTGFFEKFPLGSFQRIGSFVIFTLRDRPGSIILLRPEGTARMNQQNLNREALHSIEQDPGALLSPHGWDLH